MDIVIVGGMRIRSREVCPSCGLRYEDFRSSDVPTFQEAYGIRLGQSKEAHEKGDYSTNAYRGTVLGYMRMMKRDAWKNDHVLWCGRSADDDIPF